MPIIDQVRIEALVSDFVRVDKLHITSDGQTFDRMLVTAKDAVAVLVYNTDNGRFYFVRQLRACKYREADATTLEVVAGMLEPGEDPEGTAKRECMEEIGFRVGPLVYWGKALSAPGILTETMHYYHAAVTHADRIGKGGGLDSEHERITVVEMTKEEAWAKLLNGSWEDAKTLILLQRFFLEYGVPGRA
ncbi:MAG: NUDIX hydrolase [Bacteroidetes bacterium]|jgi:ADP-ribose pyrophosphatase|nr:NUDIX hydrolase [Bacteroidota bacterium]